MPAPHWPHVKSLTTNGGWPPMPDVAVAVLPRLSVTVNVTINDCAIPSSVLVGCPHVSVNENCVFVGPLSVSVLGVT